MLIFISRTSVHHGYVEPIAACTHVLPHEAKLGPDRYDTRLGALSASKKRGYISTPTFNTVYS
ncbi:MAG: hypothetical protein ACE3JN_17105 [Ectobacillus sp.]